MRHIREFDGLRGVLAVWVFLAHALELGPYSSLAGHLRPQFAVDIFIILSGFVIFHLLSQGEDYGTFITRRFFRLFPVYALCILFALLLRGLWNSHDEIAFGLPASVSHLTPYLATHAALLHGAVPDQTLPMSATAILPPAWSISLEWQFYLLAPLLFGLLVKPRWRLALIVFALVLGRALIERHSLGLLFPSGPRDLTFSMSSFLPLKIEFFAVGAASWLLWRRLEQKPLPVSPRALWLAWLGGPLVWCLTDSLPLAGWTALFILLMHAKSAAPSRVGLVLSRVLSSRVLTWLGIVSYPLYLVHVPTIALVRRYMAATAVNAHQTAFAVLLLGLSLIASVFLAWVLHGVIEKPGMRLGKRLTERWHGSVARLRPVPINSSPR